LFAVSDASAAVAQRLDLVGVGFVAVLDGGIPRDLMPLGVAPVTITGVRLLALDRRWSAPVAAP